MSFVVVRPAPGDARTVARLAAMGFDAEAIPLFTVVAVAWDLPDPSAFDALLLTSANAVRHGGTTLAALVHLPVVAVGGSTARAARAAGFAVAITGDRDAEAVVREARRAGFVRLLHLAGRDRTSVAATAITVYASEPVALPPGGARRFAGQTILLHSARAAVRVAELVDRDGIDRAEIALVAISAAVADAAGTGWSAIAIAKTPTDSALIERAIDRSAAHRDK